MFVPTLTFIVLPALILMAPAGLLLLYLPAVCRKLLLRRSSEKFYQTIVNVNRLEFPSVCRATDDFGCPLEYPRLTATLKCEFITLTYLLIATAHVNRRYTYEDCLLILYFKVVYLSLVTRHLLRLSETSPALELTAILKYFANVVGERVSAARFGTLTASAYLAPSEHLWNLHNWDEQM